MPTPRNTGRKAALAACLLVGLAGPAAAQTPVQPDYHPSMGDLMTMAVQPRHAKLGLALQARNWAYAAYEVDELKNALNRVARTTPTSKGQDMASIIASGIKEPLETAAAAIKAKDAVGFGKAYAQITAACNACHTTLGREYVVIRAPAASTFSNQNFAAPGAPAAKKR